MITMIEALNFRCLRYIKQPLGPFHVLVGPNASGKTTFMDVISFLGHLVAEGLELAVSERTQDFRDMVWRRQGRKFELAIEAKIPDERREKISNKNYTHIRYEVVIGLDVATDEVSIQAEKVLLRSDKSAKPKPQQLKIEFPEPPSPPTTILSPKTVKGSRVVVNKIIGGNDNFYDERGKGWRHSFKLGPRKCALANLPDDETKFPASTWLKQLLREGVQRLVLNSLLIRKASPPGQVRGFKPDGSNLPWVIADLEKVATENISEWVRHLRTALPDIEGIRTVERPDDKHRYLMICYPGGLEIPSWMASDGTLRLLALTLPAYLPEFTGIYLIEEPENGIHPQAVESAYQSLSSVYNAQILMATHSPVMLSIAEASKVLCFAKTEEGATDIVSGREHPKLKEWRGETNLGELFAAGVLS